MQQKNGESPQKNPSNEKPSKSESPEKPKESSPKVANNVPQNYAKTNYKRDCTKNMSYYDTREQHTKISIRVIIPDYVRAHLQREGDLFARFESKYNCKLAFVTDSESRVSTSEGIKGQLMQFVGTLDNSMMAVKGLYQEIVTIEEQLNGRRKS